MKRPKDFEVDITNAVYILDPTDLMIFLMSSTGTSKKITCDRLSTCDELLFRIIHLAQKVFQRLE